MKDSVRGSGKIIVEEVIFRADRFLCDSCLSIIKVNQFGYILEQFDAYTAITSQIF